VRIIIDIQCFGTASRYRGVGNYALALVKKILEINNKHEIILLANTNAKEALAFINNEFDGVIKENTLKSFHCFENTNEMFTANLPYIIISEKIRSHVIDSLKPDFVLISALFEGSDNNFVCSIDKDRDYKVGVIGYDLIPLMNEDIYLSDNQVKSWYFRKLESLKNSDYIFSISESARIEFKTLLSTADEKLLNISSAVDDSYHEASIQAETVITELSIDRPFILYSGACDERKNLKGLLNAFSKLESDVINKYQIVLVGKYPEAGKQELDKLANKLQLATDTIIYTGFITNEFLKSLYKECKVFVFPSFHEGFGLPVLEAMTCGAPTICSNASSLPEVIGIEEAMFNPYDVNDIKLKLFKSLEDDEFRDLLIANARERSKLFSWSYTADKLLTFINENIEPRTQFLDYNESYKLFIHELSELINQYSFDDLTIKYISRYIAANQKECDSWLISTNS
tara:strand:+ start:35620 stop:36993 length:1374 start_codon:yes stop_codon:yes gene_type:complete